MARQRQSTGSKLSATQRKFLAAYSLTLTIRQAAIAAKIDRNNHWKWMADDAVYQAAFSAAHEDGTEVLEAEARRRAVDGVRSKLYHSGKPVNDPETGEHAVEVEYSDRLLLALLKRHSPADWGDKQTVSGNLSLKHSGELTLQEITKHVTQDADYIAYLRNREMPAMGNSSGDGAQLQPGPVAAGKAPAGAGRVPVQRGPRKGSANRGDRGTAKTRKK